MRKLYDPSSLLMRAPLQMDPFSVQGITPPPEPLQLAPPVMPQPELPPARSPREVFDALDPREFMLSPEQESQRADRQMGVSIAQILSNQAANAANSFKPGSVDLGAQNQVFSGLKGMVDEPLAQLDRKRQATMMSEQAEQRRLANEMVRGKMDPASDTSKGLRLQVAQEADAMADLFKAQPEMSARFKATAEAFRAGGQSGIEAEAQLKNLRGMVSPIIGMDRNRAIASQNEAQLSQRKAEFEATREDKAEDRKLRAEELHNKNVLERLRLDLEERKLAAKSGADELKITKPQEKLNETISKLDGNIESLKRIQQLKRTVDTGPLAKLGGQVTDLLDMTPEDRRELRALTGSVFNEILHELSGAAISPSEMARLSAQIPDEKDQDGVFLSKIKTAISEAEKLKRLAIRRYQNQGGKMTDKSDTARIATGQSPELPAMNPNIARAKAVLSDPTASPKAKAGAQKYLDDHGGN